jgi:hypothetical protein
MDTFIYYDLKKASWSKDLSKVPTLGPYAYVLGKILKKAMFKKLMRDEKLL